MSKTARRIKFEEAMRRLEEIVRAIESGEAGIEESIDRYEEAMGLVMRCKAILAEAEARIQKIQLDAAGEPRLTPMEDEGDEEGGGPR